MTENQLKKSMPGILDKNLKYTNEISELTQSFDVKEKACFISIVGHLSDSLNTNCGLTGVVKSKKLMLRESAVEFNKFKGIDLKQICKTLDLDYESVKQRYLKTINYL